MRRALAALCAASAHAAVVTISNSVPRRDTDGDIISAGDGCISYHPDEQRYYLFGAHYQPCAEPDNRCYAGDNGLAPCQKHQKVAAGQCCGWRNATIASWSSPDLVTWTKEGLDILPLLSNPNTTMSSEYMAVFEPCGVFNRKTGFWVLYFLRDGYVLANAVARTAAGPFDVLQWTVPVPFMTQVVDFYFWQNATNGDLIMKHNSEGAGEYAATFSDDYLTITGSSAVFGHEQGYTEGGGIFQHNGQTFVMAGYGCCFCPLGSNGFLWRADEVLGNYTLLGDKVPRYANGTSVTHAQQFSVTPVYTRGGVVPMFIGIRFGSAPDFIKSHDFQYWLPLAFDGNNDMANVSWVDHFSLDLVAPPPPPPPPPPPAPWFVCSFTTLGACVEVPAGAPGAVETAAECQAACTPRYACSPTEPGACDAVPANTPGANASLAGCESACAPRYSCATDASPGQCVEVAGDFPGASATLAECQAACVLCDVAGVWYGNAAGVPITIAQGAPAPNNTAPISISVKGGEWGSNATGVARAGSLLVTGGWCGGNKCVGAVSPLEAGGVNCAMITWADGSWCSPEREPTRCKYGERAAA